MKKINVVGLGTGNIDYLTMAGIKCIQSADIVIGAERHMEDISSLLKENQKKYVLKKISEIRDFILNNMEKEITVIVSGDTGFYSLLNYLKKTLPEIVFNVIPGISSFQYLFAKLSETWENYSLYSAHGRKLNIPEVFKNSKSGVILLTDKENSPYIIGRILMKNNFPDAKLICGERLSYSDERITEFYAKDYEKYNREYEMNVLVIKKER